VSSGFCGKENFKRRRKVQLLSAFFFQCWGCALRLKAVCVLVLTRAIETLTCGILMALWAVLELLLTLKGLLQQLLGCWWLSRFRGSSLLGVFVDYYVFWVAWLWVLMPNCSWCHQQVLVPLPQQSLNSEKNRDTAGACES